MENIFLIGFMGTGKSAVSKILSKELNMNLVEMDERLEEEAGMTINQIFETKGEDHFRAMETELIRTIGREGNSVVSCGGGVPLREENVKAMKESGIIVYLDTPAKVIFERVKNSTNRPLLNGNMNLEYITNLLEQRRPKYEAAAMLTIHTEGKERGEVCKDIIGKLK